MIERDVRHPRRRVPVHLFEGERHAEGKEEDCHVRGQHSNYSPLVATDWMLCAGTDILRLMRNVRGASSAMNSIGGYQTASVLTSVPDAWVTSGGVRTGDGYDTTNVDLSGVTNKLWVRGGILGGTSGQEDGQAEVVAMTESNGQVVASGQQFLYQTSGVYYNEIAVSEPVPLVGLAEAMAAFDVEHQGADFYLYPVYRLLTNDPNAGGAWTNLASPSQFTSSQTYNSGLQTLADDTSKCFVQFGLKWKSTAGSASVKFLFVAVYG